MKTFDKAQIVLSSMASTCISNRHGLLTELLSQYENQEKRKWMGIDIYLIISTHVFSVQQGIPFLRTFMLWSSHKRYLPVIENNQRLQKIRLTPSSISRQIYYWGISFLNDPQDASCCLRDGKEAALFLHITAQRQKYISINATQEKIIANYNNICV